MPHDQHPAPPDPAGDLAGDLAGGLAATPALVAVLPELPPGGVTAGVDWATTDHVVAVVDVTGSAIDRFTVPASAVGLRELVRRLRRADVAEVAIERSDGQVVDTLLAAGFTVVVIAPGQVANLRGRYRPPETRTTGSTPTSWPTPCAPTGPGCSR